MGSCYICHACNCFHTQRQQTLYQKQQEIEQLVQNSELPANINYIENNQNSQQHNNDNNEDDTDNDQDDKFSLNTIRKERDEYDTLVVISFINSINQQCKSIVILNEQSIELIKQYMSQTKILLIETGQTVQLRSDRQHIFHSIIINRGATLTVNPWESILQKGGTLLITCISSVNIRKNASICLDSCGYKGGHCSYLEYDEEQFLDSIHDESDYGEQQQLRGNAGIYASFSGESYKGLGLPNCRTHNFGGGGAGLQWGSGGAAGYGTMGYKGQFDKQFSNKSCGKGGHVYGSQMLNPLYLGSGGGASYGGYDGGNGGGALKIECKKLVMDRGSTIRCNGGDGKHTYLSGGGSGGSIHLIVNDGNDIMLNGEAKIEAIGGEKKELYGYGYKCDDVNNCGKGGYGRIRIQMNVNGEVFKRKLKNEYEYCVEPLPYIG
eukprot:266513_1